MVNASQVEKFLSDHPGARDNAGDDELSAQNSMLPNPSEVSYVIERLGADDLREFAVSIMNAAVESAHKRRIDLDTIRTINGWFASMEETIAAGDSIEEIQARRRV